MTTSFKVGEKVFFAHPEESWIVGSVKDIPAPTAKSKGKSYTCTAKNSKQQKLNMDTADATLPEDRVHALVGDVDENVDDLLHLSYLHDSTLLHQVRRRYFENVIYTRIGPIVLALNPFDYKLPNYVDSNMPKYMAEGNAVVANRSKLLPHAWSTAHLAYWLMRDFDRNQSIIVSGESGAGKTETAKIVLRYLGKVSTQQCSAEDEAASKEVTERVNSTSPILEAFGNAKTVRNDNSSRFGKFMKVQFGSTGVMVGSLIEVYLLERSRIVTHGAQERGYHSFYQLLRGASPEQKKRLHLEDATAYRSLAIGKATKIDGVNDGDDFKEVCGAMGKVGMPEEDQKAVWDTVAGILNCIRVEFEDNANHESSVKKTATVHLQRAAEIWGVDAKEMTKEFTSTTSKVGAETFTRKLRAAQANDVKDALCKGLYERLFLCLVDRINVLIDADASSQHWVGLLDIFGFESFEHNSFEQVCINLANETLQNHYNNIIFTRDMEECKEEGVDTASVVFYDNQPCLEMLSGKGSVLALLDEECSLGKGNDAAFAEKVVDAFKKHANFVPPKTEKGVFTVKHYAGDVKYDVTGFRDKNMDPLKDSVKLMMRAAKSSFIASLLPEPVDRRGKPPTVGGIFRQQLGNLMATINSTHPHWIRCVKPHHSKKPRMFHGAEVMNQLRCAGVLETVRIRKMSYSMRFVFVEFWRMFRNMVGRKLPADGGERQGCQAILDEVGLGKELAQVGKTKVFLKFDGYTVVTDKLHDYNAKYANTVASFAASWISQKQRNGLRTNYRIKLVAAALVARRSQEQMRKLELVEREKYLLKAFRSLLVMQGEENTTREQVHAARETGLKELDAERQSALEGLRKNWERQQEERAAAQRAALEDEERVARRSIASASDGFYGIADSLFTLSSREGSARRGVSDKEETAWSELLLKANTNHRAAAKALAERVRREFVATMANFGKTETAARAALVKEEKGVFYYLGGRIVVEWDCFLVGVPSIWRQESSRRAQIMQAARDSFEFNEKKWWTEQNAKQRRQRQSLFHKELQERTLLIQAEEQTVIELLMEMDDQFEYLAALEWSRAQEEERAKAAEAKRRALLWQRREEQRRAEQQQRVQLQWRQAKAEAAKERARIEQEQEEDNRRRKKLASDAAYLDAVRRADVVSMATPVARHQLSLSPSGTPSVTRKTRKGKAGSAPRSDGDASPDPAAPDSVTPRYRQGGTASGSPGATSPTPSSTGSASGGRLPAGVGSSALMLQRLQRLKKGSTGPVVVPAVRSSRLSVAYEPPLVDVPVEP